MSSFHAKGKLLLSSEYLVLDGALALALPVNYGQHLEVQPHDGEQLLWRSINSKGDVWFDAQFDADGKCIQSNHTDTAQSAQKILQTIRALSPNTTWSGLQFTFTLDFPNEWGFGSSSTLLSLLAQWANVDPYTLSDRTFGGSAYDIACATADGPISYQIDREPRAQAIDFDPPFKQHLFFAYSGKKQNSRDAIKAYREQSITPKLVQQATALSKGLMEAEHFMDFAMLLHMHENLLARTLKQAPIQSQFADFDGIVKSLGAWGGDFLLFATEWPKAQLLAYLREHDIELVFGYDELIKQRP